MNAGDLSQFDKLLTRRYLVAPLEDSDMQNCCDPAHRQEKWQHGRYDRSDVRRPFCEATAVVLEPCDCFNIAN